VQIPPPSDDEKKDAEPSEAVTQAEEPVQQEPATPSDAAGENGYTEPDESGGFSDAESGVSGDSGTDEKPAGSPFSSPSFWKSYCSVVGFFLLLPAIFEDSGVILALFGSLFAPLVGLLLWAGIRKSSRPLALGFLLGSISPIAVIFVATGGCGFW